MSRTQEHVGFDVWPMQETRILLRILSSGWNAEAGQQAAAWCSAACCSRPRMLSSFQTSSDGQNISVIIRSRQIAEVKRSMWGCLVRAKPSCRHVLWCSHRENTSSTRSSATCDLGLPDRIILTHLTRCFATATKQEHVFWFRRVWQGHLINQLHIVYTYICTKIPFCWQINVDRNVWLSTNQHELCFVSKYIRHLHLLCAERWPTPIPTPN